MRWQSGESKKEVKEMKGAWRVAAYEDLKKLQSAAHASKRDALARAEKAEGQCATSREQLDEQQRLADELQQGVASLLAQVIGPAN
eukprot:6204213-Pleurochrysis_carterae.AAC.1